MKYFEVPLASKIEPVEAGTSVGVGGVVAGLLVPIVLLCIVSLEV